MMPKPTTSLSVLLSLALLSGCAPAAPAEDTASRQLFAMDAPMSLQLRGAQAEEALEAAVAELQRLDALLDRNEPDSDLTRLNAAAGSGVPVTLDSETLEVLDEALRYASDSGGAFDCTIAPVMDAWGFGGDGSQYRVPDPDELSALLSLVDSSALRVDRDAGTAELTRSGMEVDLGGIAKGYAADRLTALAGEYQLTGALFDLGSSTMAAVGERPGGGAWRIALRDPANAEQQLGVLSLQDESLSTSGSYERYFTQDGATYHHILDPETGYPAETGLLSVTVVTENAALADAWSTALFVLGADKALTLWESRDDFDCILCCSDGRVLVTEGLEDTFAFEGDAYGYTCEILRR